MEDRPERMAPRWQRQLRRALWVSRELRARALCPGDFEVGSDTSLGPGARILSPNFFIVGDRVKVGADFHCEGNAIIGSDILISSSVSLIGNDHAFDDPGSTVFRQGRLPATTITLEGDNLIGFGTIIIGPVTIGFGAIVGAGSLVTKDVPHGVVVVGRPASVIRERYQEGDNA